MKVRNLNLLLLGVTIATSAYTHADSPRDVINGYADLAFAKYSDSLATAQMLASTINQFVDAPSESTLQAAREAWLAARVPYQQTEAYRFGNPYVDEWEGKVNAWPLDEGLIDYVDTAFYGEENEENLFYRANIIANPSLEIAGESIDASVITPELLQQLHEIDGVEANVATGYHAIEFLLWGQDFNGTEAGAGDRPYTEFDVENCTQGNCKRRADYLTAATELLITDLQDIVSAWDANGTARQNLENASDAEAIMLFFRIVQDQSQLHALSSQFTVT